MEKLQRGKELSERERQSWHYTRQRVKNICESAHQKELRVLIDAEESWIQDTIDELTYEMMRAYNSQRAVVFNTYQMYRKDMLNNLEQALQDSIEGNYYLGVKLVRGAYMEKERERALEMGCHDPIQISKRASDEDFNRALELCVKNIDRIELCCGSHNEYSNQFLVELMEQHGMQPQDPRIYFAQLYGMSDNISFNLANAGYNVAKYLPYGPVNDVIPYLFRRAEENTAIAGQSSREYILIKKELTRRSDKSTSS